MMSSLLSPYTAFPVTSAPPLWTDPFADMASPFSLLPALGRTLDFPDMRSVARVEAGDNKALRVVFDDLGGFENVDVSIDDRTNVVTVKAEAADGCARASRVITLPCAVQNTDKITAEHIGSRVVVTIPDGSQKPRERTGTDKSKQLKVSLRPAADMSPPEFEVSDDDVGYCIKVHGVEPSSPRVEVDGRKLHVTCKAKGGTVDFFRAFALPRNVAKADEIVAKVEDGNRLVVTVPHDALEASKPPTKAAITVQNQAKAS
ncbi:hypothetical protein KFE25_013323 [Diacronema lutheri]|uniref:SHSP domain-containing protein n=1 Tax=Diacronema lutheri TaxID=2081491 RepID=A0A8J5XUL8_DIALT|nr:hypothetical protein KFE25_013323 [Diacronema lutheri]